LLRSRTSETPLDSPPSHPTHDGPGQDPEQQIEKREHPTDVLSGMFGSVSLQRPSPQRGDTQGGTSQAAEEAAEHEDLNPQKVTHWLSVAGVPRFRRLPLFF